MNGKIVDVDIKQKNVKETRTDEKEKILYLYLWDSANQSIVTVRIHGIGEAKYERSGAIRLRQVNTDNWVGFVAPIYILATYPNYD
jgi:hypothetical protein